MIDLAYLERTAKNNSNPVGAATYAVVLDPPTVLAILGALRIAREGFDEIRGAGHAPPCEHQCDACLAAELAADALARMSELVDFTDPQEAT